MCKEQQEIQSPPHSEGNLLVIQPRSILPQPLWEILTTQSGFQSKVGEKLVSTAAWMTSNVCPPQMIGSPYPLEANIINQRFSLMGHRGKKRGNPKLIEQEGLLQSELD